MKPQSVPPATPCLQTYPNIATLPGPSIPTLRLWRRGAGGGVSHLNRYVELSYPLSTFLWPDVPDRSLLFLSCFLDLLSPALPFPLYTPPPHFSPALLGCGNESMHLLLMAALFSLSHAGEPAPPDPPSLLLDIPLYTQIPLLSTALMVEFLLCPGPFLPSHDLTFLYLLGCGQPSDFFLPLLSGLTPVFTFQGVSYMFLFICHLNLPLLENFWLSSGAFTCAHDLWDQGLWVTLPWPGLSPWRPTLSLGTSGFSWEMLVRIRGSREKGSVRCYHGNMRHLVLPQIALPWRSCPLPAPSAVWLWLPVPLVPHRLPLPHNNRMHRNAHLVLVPAVPSHFALLAAS